MFKQKDIRTTIFSVVGLLLIIILIIQIFFYTLLHKKSNENTTLLFDSMVQNTVKQLNTINKNISDISFSLSVNSNIQSAIYIHSPQEHVKNLKILQNTVDDYRARDKNIVFLSVVNKGKLFISSSDIALYDATRNIVASLKEKYCKEQTYLSFNYNNKSYFAYVTPVFPTAASYLLNDTKDNYIIALYTIPTDSYILHSYIGNNNNDNLIEMFITDSKNNIILATTPDKNGMNFDCTDTSRKQLCKTLPIDNTEWFLTIKTLPENISSLESTSSLFFVLLCIIYLVVLVVIFRLLNNVLVKRIGLLRKSTLKINDNDDSYRIDYPYNDELGKVADVTNMVLDKLHHSTEENIEMLTKLHDAELMQKSTQIFYLEGQLSPHFLYNSMSHIQGIALQYNVKEIVDITISMSKVFRYISNNQSISTVAKDLNYATDYFDVINARRINPITLINNVKDDAVLSAPCLKNIFQPIIENILKHAFDLSESGIIKISSIPDNDKVIIEIEDNGKGITNEKLAEINQNIENFKLDKEQVQTSIGILNVHTRIKLYYNNESGLHIHTTLGEGTKIRIIFDKELPTHKSEINKDSKQP